MTVIHGTSCKPPEFYGTAYIYYGSEF